MNWFNNPWDGSDGLLEFERPARPVEGQGQRNDNGGAFAMIGAMLATAASLERNRRRRTDYRSGTLGLEPQSPIPLPPIQQPGGSPQPLAARYLRHKWEREWGEENNYTYSASEIGTNQDNSAGSPPEQLLYPVGKNRYKLTDLGIVLMHLFTGVEEELLAKAVIKPYLRGIASSNFKAGLTMKDEINLTAVYFKSNNLLSWLIALSHESKHLEHASKFRSNILYITSFSFDYIIHLSTTKTKREKKADKGILKLNLFKDYLSKTGKQSLIKILTDDDLNEEQKIKLILHYYSLFLSEWEDKIHKLEL